MRKPRVLFLYWAPKGSELRLTVRQHMSLLEGRGMDILYRNAIDPTPPWLAWTKPDLCVLHTTFLSNARWIYSFEELRHRMRWIAKLDCPKVALPQDEYDHAGVIDDWMAELGVTSVYSCFGPGEWETLYPELSRRGTTFHETLTGFIDEDAAAKLAGRIVPHSERPFDIVYRARNLPYWIGSNGQLKHEIAGVVRDHAAGLGLKTDISTRPEDTIFGESWLDFLMSGRAVIGTESGSSVLDSRGAIQRRISQLLAERPDLTFDEVDAQMPAGWDSYTFFAISPRHLECVITKTAQVLVEGRYSGVLEAEKHYIPLRRDFSNLDEALERLNDVEAVEAMTERAYRDVYLSGRNNFSVLGDQVAAEARPASTSIAFPFALARRPSLPFRPPIEGKPLRRQLAALFTFAAALVRQPEARRFFGASRRGRIPVPPRDAVRDVILLRVLSRIRRGAATGDERWSLSAENDDGKIMIRTHVDAPGEQPVRFEGPIESVSWNHAAVALAVAVYPRHPRLGWLPLGIYGRHEFTALAELARVDPKAAQGLLRRALKP